MFFKIPSTDGETGIWVTGLAAFLVFVFSVVPAALRREKLPTSDHNNDAHLKGIEERKRTSKWLCRELPVSNELFLKLMKDIRIIDSEAKAAWDLIVWAIESGHITPDMALESLELLRGEEDNGIGWNEYSTGADFDHLLPDGRYDFSRVRVDFAGDSVCCARALILDAYFRLENQLI